jgi:hypothetical protein
MLQNESDGLLGDDPLRAPEVPGSKLLFPDLLHLFLPATQTYPGQYCRYNPRRATAAVQSSLKKQIY